MKIQIDKAKEFGVKVLKHFGMTTEEAEYSIWNCLEGELTDKKTHGFVRIPLLIKSIKEGKILVGGENISVVKETPVSLLIDGKQKTGLYVVNKALELGIEKVKKSGLLLVGVTNTAPISGLIGQYARKAAENDLIYVGFNNSPGGLIPFGSIKSIFGTNPFTVGIPTNNIPVILDMASSKITWGNLLLAKAEGRSIPEDVAFDSDGNVTTDPQKAMSGGILPISEHKGSGLAFIVELLAGALTSSRCGHNIKGGWGSLFILIDPNILRPIEEFKNDVTSLINEVRNSPKAQGVKEIYFPGERSQKEKNENITNNEFELDDKIFDELKQLLTE
ncbi:Ldh family oxidoreductase [Candidatus Dojkabacteria bacterium]|nr:Ldh family oxidoreductase [Candidatus Dojkabacteria bacterium]